MVRNKEAGGAKDRKRGKERGSEKARARVGEGETAEMSPKVIRIGYERLRVRCARVPPLTRVRGKLRASPLARLRLRFTGREAQNPRGREFPPIFSSILSPSDRPRTWTSGRISCALCIICGSGRLLALRARQEIDRSMIKLTK